MFTVTKVFGFWVKGRVHEQGVAVTERHVEVKLPKKWFPREPVVGDCFTISVSE